MDGVGKVVAAVKGRGQSAGKAEHQRPERVTSAGRLEADIEAEQCARSKHAAGEQEQTAQTGAEPRRRARDQHEGDRVKKPASPGQPGAWVRGVPV